MKEERKKRRARGSGTLFQKKGSQLWTLQYYRDGKQIREATGLTSKSEAQKILNTRLYQLDRGELFEIKRARAVKIEDLFVMLEEHTKAHNQSARSVAGLAWKLKHLRPALGNMLAASLQTDDITRYKLERQEAGAKPATINRELATLRRAFNLGKRSTPPKVRAVPYIEMFRENNARQGFVEYADYMRLESCAVEHWLRTGEQWLRVFLEMGFTYGWRKGELLALRVRHVNLMEGTVRLDPGMAKNREGREVRMTAKVKELLQMAIAGKHGDDFVLTQANGRRVSDFRDAWAAICVGAGCGQYVCRKCGAPWEGKKCSKCDAHTSENRKYRGLIPHDLRRSAAKALRKAGVPESVIMQTGGWKTASMFRRYAIVSAADQRDAIERLEQARKLSARLVPNDPKPATADSSDRKRTVQ